MVSAEKQQWRLYETQHRAKISLNGGVHFKSLKPSDLRAIVKDDLLQAMRQVRASVGKNELADYKKWNEEFGSFEIEEQT